MGKLENELCTGTEAQCYYWLFTIFTLDIGVVHVQEAPDLFCDDDELYRLLFGIGGGGISWNELLQHHSTSSHGTLLSSLSCNSQGGVDARLLICGCFCCRHRQCCHRMRWWWQIKVNFTCLPCPWKILRWAWETPLNNFLISYLVSMIITTTRHQLLLFPRDYELRQQKILNKEAFIRRKEIISLWENTVIEKSLSNPCETIVCLVQYWMRLKYSWKMLCGSQSKACSSSISRERVRVSCCNYHWRR